MKTTTTALSITLAAIMVLSVFAMPYYSGRIQTASAQGAVTLTTSADDHGKMFFGDSLLQVIITDTSTDSNSDHLTTTVSPSVEVRDNTGALLASPTIAVQDTTAGSQRFEFFLQPVGSTLVPQDADTKDAGDLAANTFTVGSGGGIDIGESLDERFTIKIVYKSLSDTITYDSTPSQVSTDRDAYGLDNTIFMIVDDQDANADPTHRDVVITPANNATNGFIAMTGVTAFTAQTCTETGENTAEFECQYKIGTNATSSDLTVSDLSDNNVVITAKDVKKYMANNGDALIDSSDTSVANNATNQKTGQTSVSITIDDSDGILTDPGSISTSSEIKVTLTDTDRDLSSKVRDVISSASGNFVPGSPKTDLNLDTSTATGLLVWIDIAGGDIEAVPLKETQDSSGVFVPDLANNELKVSFLAAGETATPNNGVLEFDSTNTDEDINLAYVDPAPDDPAQKLTASFTKSLTRTPGTVSVTSSVGINADFTLTLNDPDLNNDPRSKDSYKLVLSGDHSAPDSTLLRTSPNNEFQLLRGSNSISDGTANALYATFEIKAKGSNVEFTSTGLAETLTETGVNTGIFTSTIDMGDVIANLKSQTPSFSMDDGDVMEFKYRDYMEDTPKESQSSLTIGRAPASIDISRDEAPVPPDTTGTDQFVFKAIGSDTVALTLSVTDPDLNTDTTREDSLTLDFVGTNPGVDYNAELKIDGTGFSADTASNAANAKDPDSVALGNSGGANMTGIFVSNPNGLVLKETGPNTGVFEEEVDFKRNAGTTSGDDWQDMRVTFVYINVHGTVERQSAGVTFRGHDAILDSDKTSVHNGDTMTVTIQDEDLNLDDGTVEQFTSCFESENTCLFNINVEDDQITTGQHTQTFTETGENTGIFTATFKVGTDIQVVDTVKRLQSTNLHLSYQEEQDSSGPSGDEIELDVPVVSSSGGMLITPDLVGPGTEVTVQISDDDLNQKPDGQDVISADKKIVEFRTDRSEVGSASVDMRETGSNTGIFQFTVQLNKGVSQDDLKNDCDADSLTDSKYDAKAFGDEGQVGACPGDILSVKYIDQNDANGAKTTVSKTVEVKSWDPVFKADKDSYNVGDKATVTIADPDANTDPDVADTLRDVRVFSDTDQVGQDTSAIETGKNTGVFKLTISLVSGATSGGVQVKRGDTVTVEYKDTFPADFVTTTTNKKFDFTFNVGGGGGQTSTTPTAPMLQDITGKPISSVTAGQQVVLATIITNNIQDTQPFAAVIEVRDNNGITVFLGWSTSTLTAGGQSNVGISWTPDNSGTYTVRTFVLSSLNNPQILSKVMESTITVS